MRGASPGEPLGPGSVRKPPTLLYGVDETPPRLITVMNGFQHVGVIAINLIYPVIVFRAAGATPATVAALLSVGLCVLGIATFMQATRRGPIGSGYMCPATFTATYLAPSILAAKMGGLPLVFGMTILAGVMEAGVGGVMRRLRSLVPTELSGLVILLIGFTAALVGVRATIGDVAHPPSQEEWFVAAVTFGVTVALNIWGPRPAKMLCALIGMLAGYIFAGLLGVLTAADYATIGNAAWLGIPDPRGVSWSFVFGLVIAFGIAALAAAMKAVGTLTVCQRTNDADWVRADDARNTRGVFADSLGSVVAGLLGTVGINTSTPSVGLASATGVASRKVALAVGTIFVVLALTPKIAALLAVMPRSVMAASLLFASCFIVINGLQVITSRLLDARRTLVIGVGLLAGVAVEAVPAISAHATGALKPIIGSSLVFGTALAFLLNMVFRLGIRQTVSVSIESSEFDPARFENFLRKQGGVWGARPEVMSRAIFAVSQLVEAVIEHGHVEGKITIEASFDEYRLDIGLRYRGAALVFPTKRPTLAEIQESEEGAALLAGFLLRRNADKVRSEQQGPDARVWFNFNH
jgi:xanthine permease XanP